MSIPIKGTHLSEKAPWETYGDIFKDPTVDAKLEAEIAEYSKKIHGKTSSQNEEELARWKEGNKEIAKAYQWLTPDEYADEGARIGRILHSSEFINLLRKAGVDCWYRNHPQAGKVTLVVKKRGCEPEVGCWVQLGYCPELSIMRFDEHDVPTVEKYRGWRTCLLQLILKGVITEERANQIFGKPKVTEQYHRYNAMIQSFRNNGNRLDE